MYDHAPPLDDGAPEPPPPPPPAPPPAPRRRRAHWRRGLRHLGLGASLVTALLVGSMVATLTIDLGPQLRGLAEQQGGRLLNRPMHIGALSVRVAVGAFQLDDFAIEGPTPADRPFLTAKRMIVSLDWTALLRRDIRISHFTMTDWAMVVEQFAGGRHTFPRLPGTGGRGGNRRVTTTMALSHARRGTFTFEDHGAPWSTIARNIDITVYQDTKYRGTAHFDGGIVNIGKFEPMTSAMDAWFTIDQGRVLFDRMDLQTDGAQTRAIGYVDLGKWPEQRYDVRSTVDFPRMREIFFARDKFDLHGVGEFVGVFRLFKGGRELTGEFTSDVAGVNAFRFPALRGDLVWVPDRFEVTNASSGFQGGSMRFSYRMAPLGAPTPARARFDVTYEDLDLAELTDFFELRGIRLAGRAAGRNLLDWPLGKFADRRGEGVLRASPPTDVAVLSELAPPASTARDIGPFDMPVLPAHVPIGGEIRYRFDPEWIDVESGRVATPKTLVTFEGRTAYGEESRMPFRAVSADWLESDQVLAGLMTAFGSPTGFVDVGGRGSFDGVMLGAFRRPRIEGVFTADAVRAWDVQWGPARGRVVIENRYVDVTDGLISSSDGSSIGVDGRFSLGFPRVDGGEEMNARVRVTRWTTSDFRHAFGIDDYAVDGLASGEFHLYGPYKGPFGFGRLTLDDVVVYGEPVQTASAGLRFEGAGVRLDAIEMQKSSGRITGAAYVSWDGAYAFNADGRRVPVESLAATTFPSAPLTGLLDFAASGAGEFNEPRYDLRGRVNDLFVGEEGVGQVSGTLEVRGKTMSVEFEAASPRLAASGAGRIELNGDSDADLTLRFTNTSLDPYIRLYEPRLSPYTRAVASGGIHIVGSLRQRDRLKVDATVDSADVRLLDYKLSNDGQIRVALDGDVVRITKLRLTGDDTSLDVSGTVNLTDERVAVRLDGGANLGILQALYKDLRASGRADLAADIQGTMQAPRVSGRATLQSGRIRHFALPHSLEDLNGPIVFDAAGVRFDGVTAKLGGGPVRFGGTLGLIGFTPADLNITATGEQMTLRYPEGIRSFVDADLTLRGDFSSPTLGGVVNVRNAVWSKRFDPTAGIFDFGGAGAVAVGGPESSEDSPVLRFDVRVVAPSTFHIENNVARIVSSADLTLRGTYDRPLIFGHADIERGDVSFEGNRYVVTHGSIEFTNPTRIEPFFDVEAETRVRAPGQTYRVVFQAAGTPTHINPTLTSDPPLAQVDILSLLFGDVRATQDAELRALNRPNELERDLLQARAARLLASPISSEVGRVVEHTFGVDSFQITPTLTDPNLQSSGPYFNARVTVGKRISTRLYLTFSQSLSTTTRDQVILLEYDQSDRLSWILSQNEDGTYALDVRVRRIVR